jgi:hypothetical protein
VKRRFQLSEANVEEIFEDVRQEQKNELENEKTTTSKKKTKKSDDSGDILGFVFFCLIAWGIYSLFSGDDVLYTPQSAVKKEIQTLIGNGADLNTLKHYYSNKPMIEWGLFYGWNNEKSDHYTNSSTLLHVFKDIKSDLYLSSPPVEKVLVSLNKLIAEYQKRNPFDGLMINQRDHFENVRIKLGENYQIVQIEINKISDELQQQNKLVTQYLADSNTSLYVSIFSLAFALLMAGVSLFRNKSFSPNNTP